MSSGLASSSSRSFWNSSSSVFDPAKYARLAKNERRGIDIMSMTFSNSHRRVRLVESRSRCLSGDGVVA
jgi:hypothetical protein